MTEPKTAAEYLDRGCDKDDQKDSKGAIEDYSKAIELNPNYAEAYANRGCAKEELGDKEGAIADWQKAADLGDEEAEKWIQELNANNKIVTPKRDAIIRRVDANDEIEWIYSSLINDKENQNYSSISKPYLIKDLKTTEGATKIFDQFDDEIVEYLSICNGGDIHTSENFIEISIKCGSDLEDPEEIKRHYLRSFQEVSDDEDVDFPEAIEVVWVMEKTLKPIQLANFKKELVEHFTNNLETEVINQSFEYRCEGKEKLESGDKEGAIYYWEKAAELGDEEAPKLIEELKEKEINNQSEVSVQYRLNNLLTKFWESTPFSASNPLPTMFQSTNEDGTINFSYSNGIKVSCFYTIQPNGKVNVEESKEVLDLNDISQTFAIISTIITDLYGPFDSETAHKELMQKELPNIFKKDDSDRVFEFYNSGINKTKTGDYKGAIDDFSKAILLDNESDQLYFLRGFYKIKLKDFKGGISDLSESIEINPESAIAYDNRGFARSELKDNKGAIEDFDRAIELNPSESNTYINRALAKAELDDHMSAYEDCSKAIELNPKSFSAYFNRANIWKVLEPYEAIEDYSKAIELNPLYSDCYFFRGELLYESEEEFEQAISDFDKVIEIGTDPLMKEVYKKRGLSKKSLGDLKGACEDWKKAAELGNEEAAKLVEENCA